MRKIWICAIGFGLAAAVVFFASLADYAYPGESASLLAQLQGLEALSAFRHPLLLRFAALFGGGNLLAPVVGACSCMLLFALVSGYVFAYVTAADQQRERERLSLIAAGTATVIFIFMPSVRSAATHLEPRLFEFAWPLAGMAAALPFFRWKQLPLWPYVLLVAGVCGFGMVESALSAIFLLPCLWAVWHLAIQRQRFPFVPVAVCLVMTAAALLLALPAFDLTLVKFLVARRNEVLGWCSVPGWVFVFAFSTLPAVVAVFASRQALAGEDGFASRVAHLALSFASILALATSFSPSALMRGHGICPVAASAAAAATAGYLVVYWWQRRRSALAVTSGGVLAFVIAFSTVWNLFVFDDEEGAFADRIAERVIEELGSRQWLVTDGSIDAHLRMAAAKHNRKLLLVSLNRDLDRAYLDELAETVQREGIGGEKNGSLKLAVSLGVLQFLNEWLADDPSVVTNVAIWGSPDLWYVAGRTPVPETLFFGADPTKVPDWSVWKELDPLLSVPRGWGSYRDRRQTDPVKRLRQSLRRHVGLVANDRGVYLQNRGENDAAWGMYELVLNEIDRDNICAIFNEVAMIGTENPAALAKRRDLDRMVKNAVDDKNRRYLLWRLSSYYGYVRDAEVFIRLGLGWARSGRPGDAIAQIRRAIDILPSERRAALMNMMAALYASDDDRAESRRIWEQLLKQNANDHGALVGLMRLEFKEGNYRQAASYLERAVKAAGDARQAKIDETMLAIMNNDLDGAAERLGRLIEADDRDLQAWSLLSSLRIHQCDVARTEQQKAAFESDLERRILPALVRAGAGEENYYVQAVRGFLLLRKGAEKRREAREAFIAAARARPDLAGTREIVIGIDISLGDRASAEAHARDELRRNRNAPLANYALGSIMLGDGKLEEAELYLRRAAEAPRPQPLALNDLAEVLRRTRRLDEAEYFARQAVKAGPKLAAAWDTLGAVLLDAGRDLDEAERSVRRACEISKAADGGDGDVRLLISLARVQLKRNDRIHARLTVRKIAARLNELSDYERREFEEIRNGVK